MGRVQNMGGGGGGGGGREKNAVYQHFLLFPQCYQKVNFTWSFKIGIVRLDLTHY